METTERVGSYELGGGEPVESKSGERKGTLELSEEKTKLKMNLGYEFQQILIDTAKLEIYNEGIITFNQIREILQDTGLPGHMAETLWTAVTKERAALRAFLNCWTHYEATADSIAAHLAAIEDMGMLEILMEKTKSIYTERLKPREEVNGKINEA